MSMTQRLLFAIVLILFLTTTALAIRAYDTQNTPKSFHTFNVIMCILVAIALLSHGMITVLCLASETSADDEE